MQNSRNYKRCLGLLCWLILVLWMAGTGWATDITEEEVQASGDDGEENNAGAVNINNADVGLRDIVNEWIGFRFTTIPIPQGATITSAKISLYVYGTANDDAHFTIYAEDTDDASIITTGANDLSDRTTTDSSVAWDGDGLGTGYKDSPDISDVVQEIVNRGSWSENNDIIFLFQMETDANMAVYAYDFGSNKPKFNCSYTAGAPPAAGQVIIIGAADFHRPPTARIDWRDR